MVVLQVVILILLNGHQIEPLKINSFNQNWFMANSTHIIDLVFHIIRFSKDN